MIAKPTFIRKMVILWIKIAGDQQLLLSQHNNHETYSKIDNILIRYTTVMATRPAFIHNAVTYSLIIAGNWPTHLGQHDGHGN